MEKEHKKALAQQSELLIESSRNANPEELVSLTEMLIKVYQEIDIEYDASIFAHHMIQDDS